MSEGDKSEGGSFKAVLAAAGGGALFLAFWLGLGVPLGFSVGAGAAGYGALWAIANAFIKRKEASLGSFVDKDLARKTVALGQAAVKALDEEIPRFDRRDPFVAKFKRLSELLGAITRDVEKDPKDATAAYAFLSLQGEACARVARLALEMGSRGASTEKVAEARERIGKALDTLISAHERHLDHLQDDNLAELQSELDVLEESLGFDATLEKALRESEAERRKGLAAPGAHGLTKRSE